MKKKAILFSRHRGYYESRAPGQFAAIPSQKIAGRLDCGSGKCGKNESRIFLRHLCDMPKGYRPCKVCKPELLRLGDRLAHEEKRAAKIQRGPHISLWATGMLKKGRQDEYEPCRWYVALNWKDRQDGASFSMQHTLSPHHRYHQALSMALAEGRRCNLPVIKHAAIDIVLLSLPVGASTAAQKALVRDLQCGKVASIHGNGVIGCASSFAR